jgi:signal transduction histidine kinase
MDYITIELALRIPVLRGLSMSPRNQSENGPPGAVGIQELEVVLDALPEIIASFDHDGRLLYLNAAARLWLQIEDQTLETAILSDLMSEPAAERLLGEALPEAARTGRWQGPGEILPRKGNPLPVILQIMSHPPDEGRRIAFTLVATPLQDSIADRETLIATSLGFLHDLNNLLGPILAYAALAQEKVESSSPVHRYLAQILAAAERARGLSERVLKRMRPRESASRRVVLADLVREVAAWLRAQHPHHDVQVESPLSNRGILGDAVGLQQMVLNLGNNAVEALPPEGGKVWMAVREVEGRNELRLTVRDNGHGMDEAVLGRIFEPFFSTKPGGTGVGLSITREVVRRHRGTMTIESAKGSGTSFHVQLPLDDAAAE